jgi:hypothetical protein
MNFHGLHTDDPRMKIIFIFLDETVAGGWDLDFQARDKD